MRFDRHREIWEHLGQVDPDWAVITQPDRRFRGWEQDLAAFYRSGDNAVDELLRLLPARPAGIALDWGAGTGRLTFALARRFDRVIGVDVSRSMLATAADRMAKFGIRNVELVHLDDYRPDGRCDLVLSQFVLQHLPTTAAVRTTLEAMVESLSPRGQLAVEALGHIYTWRARLEPRVRLHQALRALRLPVGLLYPHLRLSGIASRPVPPQYVCQVFRERGLIVTTHARETPDYGYVRYVARFNTV